MSHRVRAASLFAAAWAAGAALPGGAWAAQARGGLDAWIHGFNLGSGALILNPVIILIQWANFLILLIVLNQILYKPLWRLMRERSGKIQGDRAAAERDRKEAMGYVSQYEDSLAEIQRENTEALIALQQEMTEAGRRRVEEVRRKTSRELEEARASVASQASRAAGELEGRAGQMAAEIASRIAGRRIA